MFWGRQGPGTGPALVELHGWPELLRAGVGQMAELHG